MIICARDIAVENRCHTINELTLASLFLVISARRRLRHCQVGRRSCGHRRPPPRPRHQVDYSRRHGGYYRHLRPRRRCAHHLFPYAHRALLHDRLLTLFFLVKTDYTLYAYVLNSAFNENLGACHGDTESDYGTVASHLAPILFHSSSILFFALLCFLCALLRFSYFAHDWPLVIACQSPFCPLSFYFSCACPVCSFR